MKRTLATIATRKRMMSQYGKPYVWGGNGPSNFDCSGLFYWALKDLVARYDISLPDFTAKQLLQALIIMRTPISRGPMTLDIGFIAQGTPIFGYPDGLAIEVLDVEHVALYLPGNRWLHAVDFRGITGVTVTASGHLKNVSGHYVLRFDFSRIDPITLALTIKSIV